MSGSVEANSDDSPKKHNSTLWQWLGALAVIPVIALLTILLSPSLSKEIERVEMVYSVTIAEAPSSFLNRGIIVINRDKDRIRCQLPTKAEVNNGVPMECTDIHGDPILINPNRPV